MGLTNIACNLSPRRFGWLGAFLFVASLATAQTTVSTGSIEGTVSDPTGAAVANATVTITGKATGQVYTKTTTSTGAYSSGSLIPGDYSVRVEAPGFSTTVLNVTVQVGVTANGNVKLSLGTASQVVEVTATAAGVNPDQATVQGVLTATQIDQLPINGRNFLDLAQLEPGVQIQDGTNFDPTKVGYSSISFGGRFGRTARISVDGVDVSDETVGTTTEDVPSSGIQEFQLSQSNLDLSNDLTSSGAVNVVTRSGTNDFHGELFYYLRDSRFSAQLPHPVGIPAPYQRNQMGGRFGGPIIKDKLFFFLDMERTKQDASVPVLYASPFQGFSGTFQSPFRENEPMARLDWQATRAICASSSASTTTTRLPRPPSFLPAISFTRRKTIPATTWPVPISILGNSRTRSVSRSCILKTTSEMRWSEALFRWPTLDSI